MVRELDDEDPVLRHQPHEGDEPHLAVDVQGREAQEGEEERARDRQRSGAREDDERIPEALELGRQHQEDQNGREEEDPEEAVPLRAQLARLTGVIDRETLGQRLRRLGLEIVERLVQRHARRDDALDANGVELLEPLQLARLGRRLQRGEGRKRHQPPLGPRHVDVFQLIRGEALAALHLGDHLVASPLDAEAVDVIPAQEGGQVAPGLAHLDSLGAHLVAVEDHLGLRLVELHVRVGVHEEPALECLPHELVRERHQLGRLGGRGDHEIHGKVSAARKRGRDHRDHADARDLRESARGLHLDLRRRLLPLAPGLGHDASEASGREHELERVLVLGERAIDLLDLRGIELGLVQGRIRRRLDDPEHDALVLLGRQLPLREHVEGHDEQHHEGPEHVDDAPVLQRAAQRALVAVADPVEAPVDPAREPALRVARAEQLRSHHGREREGDDPGHDDRARQREPELPEERARQSALDRHRRIDRRQRDRHRDDRSDQLARRIERRAEGFRSVSQVPLDVLDHHDRVVHHEPHREHDGEEREEIDRESRDLHDEHGADERDRDRHDRDDHGAEPRKRKMMSTTMRSVSVRVFKTSWMALSMYSVES